MSSDLLVEFRNKVSREIDIEQEGLDRFIIYSPFMFDDGDHFVVILRKKHNGWYFTDEGHTLMHLSYTNVDIQKGTRGKIVEESLIAHGVTNNDGELLLEVPNESFGDSLYSYLQALSRITTVTKLSQERVASTFLEDFKNLLNSIVLKDRMEFNWYDPDRDPDAFYTVPYMINHSPKRTFVFPIQSDSACTQAVVICLMFERWNQTFRSLAIFHDQTQIARKYVAQLSNVIDRQFSSLGEQERIKDYFRKEILTAYSLSENTHV